MTNISWKTTSTILKKCSHKLCKDPWKPIGKFSKDKSKPDGLCLFCKDCQKGFRDKSKEKRNVNNLAYNKKMYKGARIKAPKLQLRQCIGYAPDGSRCKVMSDDYFCLRCKAIKKAKEKECDLLEYEVVE